MFTDTDFPPLTPGLVTMNPERPARSLDRRGLRGGAGRRRRSAGILLSGLAIGLFVAAGAAHGAGPPTRGRPPAGEDARLGAFFLEYLDASFRASPLWASRMGDYRYDGRLDDVSAGARAARLSYLRATREKLPEAVRVAGLSRDGRIDFDIFRRHLDCSVWLAENFRPYEDDPLTYDEPIGWGVYSVATRPGVPRELSLRNLVARMARVPAVIEAAKGALKNPPRFKTVAAIRNAEGALGFYRDGVYAVTGVPKGSGELGQTAPAVVAALEGYLAFLKNELEPRSTGDWRIGRDRFAGKLEMVLDPGLSADELLAEAESEAERVEREMGVVARQMWGTTYPDEALPTEDQTGRRETIRRVLAAIDKDHGTRASMTAGAHATVGELRSFIARHRLLILPDPDRCVVREMSGSSAGDSVAYFGPSPVFDPGATPTYFINPPPPDWPPDRVESYLAEYNRTMLKVLTMHEAYPGHYVQHAHAERHPSLIRKVLSSDTFVEGWAVYAEQMMLDQGYGGGDPALRLNQLKFYLRSVVNAILDRKRHTEGMSDDEAMAMLTGRAFQTEGEATRKVGRTRLSSCQLSTYFAGRTALHRLRQKVQKAQGPRFNIGRYHEAVLGQGPLPVRYLPELVADP